MHVTVRLFAGLRDRAGASSVALELPDGACVGDALDRLGELTDGLRVVMAVNREYAEESEPLHADDELALIPPLSGGAGGDAGSGEAGSPARRDPTRRDARRDVIHARVTGEPLSLDPLVAFVSDPRAGAVVTFAGVTREVDHLEYDAYTEMALSQMSRILAGAVERHGLCAAAAEHRTGRVARSEPSVLVAASAPHRGEAFAGAREIIDRLKELAPIWKNEQGEWLGESLPRPSGSPPRPLNR